jgi:hypothetical protein
MLQWLSRKAVDSWVQPLPGEVWAHTRWSLVWLTHQYQAAGLAKASLAGTPSMALSKNSPSLVLNEDFSCQAAMVNVLYLYTVFE